MGEGVNDGGRKHPPRGVFILSSLCGSFVNEATNQEQLLWICGPRIKAVIVAAVVWAKVNRDRATTALIRQAATTIGNLSMPTSQSKDTRTIEKSAKIFGW